MSCSSLHPQAPNTAPDLVWVLHTFLRKKDGETKKRQRKSGSKGEAEPHRTPAGFPNRCLDYCSFPGIIVWGCNIEEDWRVMHGTGDRQSQAVSL